MGQIIQNINTLSSLYVMPNNRAPQMSKSTQELKIFSVIMIDFYFHYFILRKWYPLPNTSGVVFMS